MSYACAKHFTSYNTNSKGRCNRRYCSTLLDYQEIKRSFAFSHSNQIGGLSYWGSFTCYRDTAAISLAVQSEQKKATPVSLSCYTAQHLGYRPRRTALVPAL